MTKLLTTTAVALALMTGAAGAVQITAGPSVQPVTFTRTSTGLSITAPATVDLLAFDTTQPTLGGAWFLGLGFTTGPEANGMFTPNANSFEIKYQAGSNYLLERVTATLVQDDTTQPKVFGTGVTTEVSGSADFVAAFPVGGKDSWDFILNDLGVTLTNLVGSASATISTVEKVPSAIAEPESLALLGGALVGLGLVAWWFGRGVHPHTGRRQVI